MPKIEVTDEMVERARVAYRGVVSRSEMRAALEAALNPPTEPEIVVTEEMENAGLREFPCDLWDDCLGRNKLYRTVLPLTHYITLIYRAMRALEPKQIAFYLRDDTNYKFMHPDTRHGVKDRRVRPYTDVYSIIPAPWTMRGDRGRHGPNSGHGRRSTDPFISEKWRKK